MHAVAVYMSAYLLKGMMMQCHCAESAVKFPISESVDCCGRVTTRRLS